MRQDLGLALGDLGELAFKGFGDTGVKRASRLAQQRAIGRVLHQGMLEQVARLRRHALPEQQACLNETVERRPQLRLGLARHRRQQRMRELPPDRRPDLRHLLGRAEPVEPRHQRGVQACRDRQGRRRNRRNRAPGRALALRLQHRLRHLLDEQRNAVGALDDLRHHIRRQRLVPDQARDDGGRFTLAKPVERQARHMRLSHPRRVELGAERHDEQRRKRFNPVHGPAEHLQARRVDPVHILEDHQHRLPACQPRELRHQRFQRSLPALFRGQLERGIASIIRQRQHLGEECGILEARSRSVRAAHRACRASPAVCRRTPVRRRVPSGR